MTLDHLREIALIQISQSQRNAAMQPSPIFFLHNGSVVRGRVHSRYRNHVLTVIGEHYVFPDGNVSPIYLGFKRKLGHEEVATDAGVLLAMVADEVA